MTRPQIQTQFKGCTNKPHRLDLIFKHNSRATPVDQTDWSSDSKPTRATKWTKLTGAQTQNQQGLQKWTKLTEPQTQTQELHQ